MKEILELLQTDARLTPGQIAVMLGRDEEEVACNQGDGRKQNYPGLFYPD